MRTERGGKRAIISATMIGSRRRRASPCHRKIINKAKSCAQYNRLHWCIILTTDHKINCGHHRHHHPHLHLPMTALTIASPSPLLPSSSPPSPPSPSPSPSPYHTLTPHSHPYPHLHATISPIISNIITITITIPISISRVTCDIYFFIKTMSSRCQYYSYCAPSW